VQVDETKHTGVIPVYMVIEPGKVEWTNGSFRSDAPSMTAAINAGLRAQLRSQSLVTGQLTVDLDFYPGTPIVLAHLKGKTLELPTMPSDMQNLKDEISDLQPARPCRQGPPDPSQHAACAGRSRREDRPPGREPAEHAGNNQEHTGSGAGQFGPDTGKHR
jgi:hypothetical protein